MSSLRSSCQLPLSPPLAKLPALAAPKQNLELGMGKGVPARERAGTKYWCLFVTVVFFPQTARSSVWSTAPWTRRGFPLAKATPIRFLNLGVKMSI